ncbi:uncharacterized protein LAESUDRAFT_147443 [Laetiporus sulphureus 93-53]|uniref:Secreted protein n=1 Tax=Laetiporus sulphureus 93-53 TaxID=1314785 RepID=A0A165EBG7_9APHY|nr:uncharacterized protein LAESUDRAFT_147443 [Laetiporus sulphureus 93-53]KZT06663.1 hypothetical protein LAESUDRAFT_147443 [Laetiporus sulphureus 93-53]
MLMLILILMANRKTTRAVHRCAATYLQSRTSPQSELYCKRGVTTPKSSSMFMLCFINSTERSKFSLTTAAKERFCTPSLSLHALCGFPHPARDATEPPLAFASSSQAESRGARRALEPRNHTNWTHVARSHPETAVDLRNALS